MTPPQKPADNSDVMAGLPRTRPQRRSTRRAASLVSTEAAPAVKPPAVSATTAPATKAPAAEEKARSKPRATPTKPVVSPPPLDHPVPDALPGAPFAPPPATAARKSAQTAPEGTDVVALALHAASEVAQAGVGVAKAILSRVPRP